MLADRLPGVDDPERLDEVGMMLFELPARWKICDVSGFTRSAGELMGVPGVDSGVERSPARGRRASEAAWRSRFVVPVDFEVPERAEHTTTTRLPESRYELLGGVR